MCIVMWADTATNIPPSQIPDETTCLPRFWEGFSIYDIALPFFIYRHCISVVYAAANTVKTPCGILHRFSNFTTGIIES